jgi:hypothetical protein
MSLINPALWATEFGDRPMPDNCTYEMLCIRRTVEKDIPRCREVVAGGRKLQTAFAEKGVRYDSSVVVECYAKKINEILEGEI